ncbi:MAG: rhamnulokinase family protein [Planctomycetota bacterium]
MNHDAARHVHLAVDLGAESGRVIVGTLADGRIHLHEAHRFRHLPVPTPAGLCWDLTGLWRQVLDGLRLAADHCATENLTPVSVGVDTWGVDFATLAPGGALLGLPRCYRDPAFHDAFERVTAAVPPRELYDATGIQLMPLNSLYQLESRHRQDPALAERARHLAFMPDLFHWLLTGVAATERTIASTSQMLDVRTGDWNRPLLDRLGLPHAFLQPPTDPGTPLGPLLPEVARATGLPAEVCVVLPPSHDTASAVAAVPAEPGDDWCYLSSGTWSLLGAELHAPCITDAAADAPFTNELGIQGTVRFLKNIAGLWLIQELRRDLERQGQPLEYAQLTEHAAAAAPFRTLLPVNDPAFAQPGQAIERIRRYARQTGQPEPESVGQLVRAGLESLALEYRHTLRTLEATLGRSFSTLHIVGGGGKNRLLNRMTAQATGKPVVVGPEEATAIGNLLTQALGTGRLAGLDELRAAVRASVSPERIDPSPADLDAWEAPAERYRALPPVQTP